MSPWLFNLFMGGVLKEVHAKVLERGTGMQCVEDGAGHGGWAWEARQLFADDIALVAMEKLLKLVSQFRRVITFCVITYFYSTESYALIGPLSPKPSMPSSSLFNLGKLPAFTITLVSLPCQPPP